MESDFLSAVEFSHYLLKKNLKAGDIAVDATAGNGNDSKFLAELVAEEGKVYIFDIQKQAVENTKDLLKKSNLINQTKIIKDNHANLDNYLKEKINAVIFNLGYLPGGDKKIITKSKTTLTAVKKGLALLKNKGVLILVIYSGHPGGEEEKRAVSKFVSNLDYKKYNILNYKFLNQPGPPPEVIAIKKRK